TGCVQETGACILIRTAGGMDHFIQSYAIVFELGGVYQDLVLLDFSAEDGDLRDAWYGEQTRPDRPVCESPQVHGRRLTRGQADLQDDADGGGDRHHLRLVCSFGEAPSRKLHLLADELAGTEDVRARLENASDDRQSCRGRR